MHALTPDTVRRLDRVGPRYTSYPTADRMGGSFGPEAYVEALGVLDGEPEQPLSVYVHFPHCAQICRYCACNIIGTRNAARRRDYVALLLQEIDLVRGQLPSRRRLGQLHFGGGTPNSYAIDLLAAVLERVSAHFRPEPHAELAIEIDPRHASPEQLRALRGLGFNRVSFGVQDFDEAVQRAIGRHQSAAQTRLVVEAAREAGFQSVNMDLVYGLPDQSLETFDATLAALTALRPDRVALFSFAFIPRLRVNQRRIDPASLPLADHKLAMLCLARMRLAEAGYVAVGMDHFALPEDGLATARARGRLSRNFQGYTVLPEGVSGEVETLGFGLTAIGDIGGALVQNTKSMTTYEATIVGGGLPVERGLRRSADDHLRRAVISGLMTHARIDLGALVAEHGEAARSLVADKAVALKGLMAEGLLRRDADGYALTELGELFPRLVAMVFDAYFAPDNAAFSRIV